MASNPEHPPIIEWITSPRETLQQVMTIRAARNEWQKLGLHVPSNQTVGYTTLDGYPMVSTTNKPEGQNLIDVALVEIKYQPPDKMRDDGARVTIARHTSYDKGSRGIKSQIFIHEPSMTKARKVDVRIDDTRAQCFQTFVLEGPGAITVMKDLRAHAGALNQVAKVVDFLPKADDNRPIDIPATIAAFTKSTNSFDHFPFIGRQFP